MSGAKLVVKQSFGINPTIKNCLSFSEDHHLAYASGNQIAVINTESKEQNFISGTNTYQHQSLGITAIVCSIAKKIIAVAEKVEPAAIVTFYDAHTLKKRKLLTFAELGSNEIRCIAFSEDGRYLLTQGCGPEWNLVMWNIEKTVKVICSLKISLSDDNPVHQVSFCPWDTNVILVIGKSILRMFRFIEGQLRPITLTVRRDSANFISFCWLPEEILILGTESGEILLIENLEYRGYIYPVNTGGDNADDLLSPVHCISVTPRGFAIGGNDGVLKLFERKDEVKEKFEMENLFTVPGDVGHIHAFAIGSDETLVIGTSKHNLLCISLSNLKALIDGNKDVGAGFENILTPFHGPNAKGECAIIGIDIALWKQIVVTCGKDRTVRVWNPADKKVELMKEFEEEPLSITVHPSGIYIAVAFPDKIKVLSLLLDDIYCCREITARQCSYIKFSHGGQYIAAANGTHLQLYNTFTGMPAGTLRGHNNKIKSVVWMNFDSRIMTVGSEGMVYFWDLFPVNRRPEHYSGTVPISSGIGPVDGSKCFIATHDKLVKELTFVHVEGGISGAAAAAAAGAFSGLEGGVKPSKDIELGSHISCMVYDETRKMLLLGTSGDDGPGAVITALTSPQLSSSFDINHIHSGPVTAMCQSYDGSTLYSGDANGCLVVSEFENSAFSAAGKLATSKPREGLVSFDFVEEVVIHKTDLENRKAQITKLTSKVDELNRNNEYQLRLKEMEHKEKLKEITLKFREKTDSEGVKYKELNDEKQLIETEFGKKVKSLENKQIEELRAIESKYKLKQNTEENRHKILVEETEDAHRRWNEENQTLVNSHQTYLQELTLEYEGKLLNEQRAQKNIHHDKEHLQVHFDSVKGETENDGDREVAELKIKYDGKLKAEEETGIELMAQHALLKKDLQIRSKDSNQQKEEIKRLKDKETRLYETIHSLEKDIQSHKKEIREREETITDKEKRIFDLKKKNQELEKFRFVLDYKIKELKLQIKPRETEINTMRKQIEEMNLELDQYHKSNLSLNLVIEELKLKLEGVKHELAAQNERYELNIQLMERFKRDLQELWLQRHDQTVFKASVITMYQVYVQEDVSSGSKSKEVEDPQQVYNRDREQMERSLDSLRRALKTEAQAHKRDQGKMMRESVMLTKELNSLRKNARSMQLQKKAIDAAGEIGPNTDLTELMDLLGLQIKKNDRAPGISKTKGADGLTLPTPPSGVHRGRTVQSRSTALKTTTGDGRSSSRPSAGGSRHDQWEAWREIQMQYEQMKNLEDQLTALCNACNIDPDQLIVGIDSNLAFV